MSDSDQEYIASSEDEYNRRKSTSGRVAKAKGIRKRTDSKQNAEGTYAWEGDFERTWDLVQEDAEGSLTGVVSALTQSGKRKRYR